MRVFFSFSGARGKAAADHLALWLRRIVQRPTLARTEGQTQGNTQTRGGSKQSTGPRDPRFYWVPSPCNIRSGKPGRENQRSQKRQGCFKRLVPISKSRSQETPRHLRSLRLVAYSRFVRGFLSHEDQRRGTTWTVALFGSERWSSCRPVAPSRIFPCYWLIRHLRPAIQSQIYKANGISSAPRCQPRQDLDRLCRCLAWSWFRAGWIVTFHLKIWGQS